MSTLVFVDPEISTQADGAQSPRVPVPFPEDPYEAIRQAYLVGTDTESEPFEDLVEIKAPKTARMAVRVPPAMSSGLSASIAEGTSELVEDDKEEDDEIEESSYSDSVSEDAKDEGPTAEDEDPAAGDEGLTVGDEGPGIGVESLRLGGDEAVPEGQQRAAPVVKTAMESERPERVSALMQPTLTTWIDPEDGIAYINVPAYPPPAPPAQTPPSPE
ncbi:hypothetical protein Tco_1303069 [Tanacetum coccineum]